MIGTRGQQSRLDCCETVVGATLFAKRSDVAVAVNVINVLNAKHGRRKSVKSYRAPVTVTHGHRRSAVRVVHDLSNTFDPTESDRW